MYIARTDPRFASSTGSKASLLVDDVDVVAILGAFHVLDVLDHGSGVLGDVVGVLEHVLGVLDAHRRSAAA